MLSNVSTISRCGVTNTTTTSTMEKIVNIYGGGGGSGKSVFSNNRNLKMFKNEQRLRPFTVEPPRENRGGEAKHGAKKGAQNVQMSQSLYQGALVRKYSAKQREPGGGSQSAKKPQGSSIGRNRIGDSPREKKSQHSLTHQIHMNIEEKCAHSSLTLLGLTRKLRVLSSQSCRTRQRARATAVSPSEVAAREAAARSGRLPPSLPTTCSAQRLRAPSSLPLQATRAAPSRC